MGSKLGYDDVHIIVENRSLLSAFNFTMTLFLYIQNRMMSVMVHTASTNVCGEQSCFFATPQTIFEMYRSRNIVILAQTLPKPNVVFQSDAVKPCIISPATTPNVPSLCRSATMAKMVSNSWGTELVYDAVRFSLPAVS